LIDLENKGNMLYSTNDDYALYGLIPLKYRNCFPPYPILIATKNIWESDLNSSPQYGFNHELEVYGAGCTPPLQVNVTDASPGQLDCISFGNPLLPLNMANTTENSTFFSTLCDDFSLLSTETAFQSELGNYCNAIQNFDPTNTSEYLQKRKAYADAHKLLNAYYEHVAFNNESLGINSAIDMLQDLNYALINTESETEYAKIDYDLDIGLLERYRGNYDAAISHLEALILEIQEYEPELFFVEKWLCSLYAEKLLTEGSINYDEFDALIMECEARYEENMATLSDELPANESTNNNEENNYMQISPNPNDGSFTVNINCELNNAEIRVSNSIGQPISTTVLSNTGEQVINITGLSVGQYTVYYIINGSVIESDVVFVE
jgi:tetratricopeptide (TPR) repeat protein